MPSPSILYLVDISSFIFRAFFAVRPLHNKAGEPTHAVYGVVTMLVKLIEEANPQYLAIVYDSKEPSFRKTLYPEYKSNRSAPPEALIPQFSRIEAFIESFEMHSYRQSGVEADDLIATLTKRWCALSTEHQVVIVSSDKDFMQLVDARVSIWDTMSGRKYGPAQVEDKFGVGPSQMRDYLALVGDASDHIPGVLGIGPKGAVELLKKYGCLSMLLEAAQKGEILGKKGEALRVHQKDALLSADLVAIRQDLLVDMPLDSLAYQFHLTEASIRLFKELDFHSLVKKWSPLFLKNSGNQQENATIRETPPIGRFRTIDSEKAFYSLLEELSNQEEFALDLETTSLNPREAEIIGISISYDPHFGVYIPLGHLQSDFPQLSKNFVFQQLKPFLESSKIKKIGQNLKYDFSVLVCHGLSLGGIGGDTMVAAYLLEPGERTNLKTLAFQYLDYEMLTYEEVCGKGKEEISFAQVTIEQATRYSAEDAWITLRLWHKLKPALEKAGLWSLFYSVDLPLVQVLEEMECQGVCIDDSWLKKLSQEMQHELEVLRNQIQVFVPSERGPLNLNSPKQLASFLFEDLKLPPQGKIKTGYSTDASVLETLASIHEVPRLLLEYREISKLKGTYVDPLPFMKDPRTGKIHASFHQTVTATGRLSSSNPNLQNIPVRTDRGLKIRKGFVASSGNILIAADYSQIELRILAHLSQDLELMRCFLEEEDVHRRTAGEIFSISPEEVTERQRGIAKAINFGLIYGKTSFGLSQELRISRKQAEAMIERYFDRYRGVKSYLDALVVEAHERGYVTSLMGRVRKLPEIRSQNKMIRNHAERIAMNTPIQSTAADLIKVAMIQVNGRLKQEGLFSKMIIQVHDELVLDCPVKEEKRIKDLLIDVMEKSASLCVPLRVNVFSGKNWMEL